MALTDSIKIRRSIRKYSGREVTDSMLRELLELAARTQTMGNLQLYSVVVTRDEDMKQKLAPAHFNQPMVMGAPVVLTVCADWNRTTRWCQERKAEPGYDNLLSFLNAASDTLLYTQTFCNLAEEKGLGICYLGTTLYSSETIIEVLNLPRLVMPIATLTVGWPDEQPTQSDRLPLASFLHKETYRNYSSRDIDLYYSEKESLVENQEFIRINKKDTLAQVYTDCRYTRTDNEAISKMLLAALQRQGFLD